MFFMKKLALLIALVSLCGTAIAADKVMYKEITDNKPDVGVSTTVYLGDRMLEQRTGQYQECIVPRFNSLTKFGGIPLRVIDGIPICKSDAKQENYTPPYLNSWSIPFKIRIVKVGTDKIKLCGNAMCTDDKNYNEVEIGPKFVLRQDDPQRAIEYAGRFGDIAKFNYIESTDGFVHQTITREFQVDLTQGKVAAYKGAVIEIESTTNSSITYKVLRNFHLT
jgi:hypothetical protein